MLISRLLLLILHFLSHLLDLTQEVPAYDREMLFTVNGNVTLLAAEVAGHKDNRVVMRGTSYLLVYLYIGIECTAIHLLRSSLNKALLTQREYLGEPPRSGGGRSIHVRKESYLSEILVYLEFLDIGVRAFLDNNHVPLSDKVHLGSLLVFFEDVIIHAVGLIYQQKGDL